MAPYSLIPSLPANSAFELISLLERLKGQITEFQVDFVDGQFAPSQSWPFTEADPLSALTLLKPLAEEINFEADLMVRQPEQYIATLVEIPFRTVIFHAGSSSDIRPCIAVARAAGLRVGVAATADISVEKIAALVTSVDFIQLMGIAAVGQQGQPFDDRILTHARTLRQQFPDLTIAIDGAVNRETLPLLMAAGVNRFAPGSAIARASDPVVAYQELKSLLIPN